MALTKKQKGVLIEQSTKGMKDSKSAIFTEFKGVAVEDFKKLRCELKKVNADLKVVKKRLLNLVLKKLGVSFDTMAGKDQMAAVFSKNELSGIASVVHKFSKDITKGKKGSFSVLAAFDAIEKRMVGADEFKAIATLPSREALLAQVAMMLTMPLKQMMMVLNEKSKKA